MAWNTPRIWTTGQLVDASALNVDVRDNLAHLKLTVNDSGKIPALSSTYFADMNGAGLTGVVKTAADNDYTAGVQDFSAGAGTRFVAPVGADKWAI